MVEPALKKNKKITSYVIVGNPGAGKSTLLNGLMGKAHFGSGVSFGEGKTQTLQVVEDEEGRKFIDTPGLADINIRKKAADAIDQAFQVGGPYTLVFVITLESGRLRPDDLATIKLVLESTGLASNQFAVIINKITPNAMKKLEESPQARKSLFVGINASLPAKTMFIHYYERDKDLEDANDKVLPINEGFRYFLDAAPNATIKNPTKIDKSKWETLKKLVGQEYDLIRKAADADTEEYKEMAKSIQHDLLKQQDRLFRYCPRCALYDGKFCETKPYSLNRGIFVTCLSCCREIGDCIEYCTNCTLRVCGPCLQRDFNLTLLDVKPEIIATVFDPNGGKSKPTSYVVVGNPGAGKSTFLNGLMGEVKFESGVSFGEGKTQIMNIQSGIDGRKYIDTPGLADIEIRQRAAEEIDKAFQTGGPYTLIFVITIESGRLRPDDIATMKLVLEATQIESNQFSVVINKIPTPTMTKLKEAPFEGKKKIFMGLNAALPVKTMFIYYYERDDKLEDVDNKKLPISESFRQFLSACPIVPLSKTSGKIDTTKWKDTKKDLSVAQQKESDEKRASQNPVVTRTKLIYCPQCALFEMIFEEIQSGIALFKDYIIKEKRVCCQIDENDKYEVCLRCGLKICLRCLYDLNIDKLEWRERLEGDDRKESNTFNQNSHQIEESKLSIREDISPQFSARTWELIELSITDAKIGDDKVIAIASNKTWVNLTKLQLPNNAISAKGAIELTKNTTWTELAVLDLGVNSIGDEGAKELAKNTSWTKLVFLDLIKNSIGDEGAEELAKNTSWTNLVYLGLDQNLIGDKGAKGLAKNISWAKLEELNIHYNYSLGDEGVLALLNNTTWTNLKKNSIGMFPESKILQDPQDFELLREWISPISKVIFKLLYQGSRDGYGAAMFHKKCDNSMNTVTIVKSKTHNKIFGGYCDAFWNPFSNYKNATDNFLFSITEKRKYDLKANCKIYGSYANASYGPTFGGGHDFMIADNCNTNSASYSNFGHTYYNGQNDGYDQTKLAGAYNFTVEEIEVYHVDFDQETVSGILKDADFKQIKEWITNDKKIQLLRIYQATKHGFNASQFHARCDHQGPTVVVIKSSLGKTFGGFTDKDWTSDGVYRESSNSFLFSIDKKGKYPLKPGQESTAWYCYPSYGPTFGGGHDFMIADNCNTNSASYSYFPYSYDCNENVQPSTSDYLAGAYNFQVDEIEVFSVQ